jgi:hypothetical protein
MGSNREDPQDFREETTTVSAYSLAPPNVLRWHRFILLREMGDHR